MTSSSAPDIWFGPSSQTTNSASAAGEQFMSLFNDPASWQVTASQSAGFVVGYDFILSASNAELTQVFDFLNQHHIALVLNTDLVPIQANGVGTNTEGFADPGVLEEVLQRISSLGGTVAYVTMDSPLYAGAVSASGPQLSVTELAQQVATNVALVKALFPAVQFIDAEPVSTTADLVQWAQAFQAATGSAIVQFDADVNWNTSYQSGLEAYAAAVRATGATFGIIGDATSAQTGNLSWAVSAEANIAAAEANPLIDPSAIRIETWDPYPTGIGPEGQDGTLAHVAVEAAEITPLYSSGYLTGGQGVTVSTVVPASSYVGSAVDAVTGEATTVPGVEITASAPAGMTFAVVLTDVDGTLSATASGAGQVSGAGTDVMTLTGDLTDINAELASLTYTGSAAGTDTIDVTTYDGVGLVDDHQIAVDIAAPIAVTLPSGVAMATLYQNIYGVAPSAATVAAAQAALNAGQTLAQVAAPWIAQGQATITALCEQVQGATPTASVIASLTEALMGGDSISQIRTSLANASSVQSELAAFYQSQYGVAPTVAQLAALTQQLASGTSLEAVEAPLLANSQAETQITTLYQQVEGQAPDATDLATQARALLTGTSLATIRDELATSSLVQGNLATLYQHVYDQSPTTAQLSSLTAELEGTTTYAQVTAQLTAVAQADVTGFFQSVLDRSPTTTELSTYTQGLTSGDITLNEIVSDLAYSAASIANVTAIYQQVMGQAPDQAMITKLEECLSNPAIPLTQLSTDLQTAATLYQQITGQVGTADDLVPLMADFLNDSSVSQIRFWVANSAQENQLIENAYQQAFGNSISAATLTSLKASLVAGSLTMTSLESQLAAQAAADVPVISGVVKSQTLSAVTDVDASQFDSLNAVFSTVSITDPNPGAVETVTVTLSGGGSLTGGGTGTFNATQTVYTVQGSAAAVSAALDKLSFVPPAGGGTAQLLLEVENGAGNSATTTVSVSSPSSNTLVLQGGGVFDLAAPAAMENIQTLDATEGQSAAMPTIFLRNGLNLTLNLASAATNPLLAGAVVHGATNSDGINLGAGNDTVYVGNGETVHGGSGTDTYSVTSATVGETIVGGSGTSYLYVQGGGTEVMGTSITGMNAVFLENAGTSYNFTANATSGMIVHTSADADTITVGSASQSVYGSTGNLLVLATAADAGVTIRSGTGSNELEITTGGTVTLNSALSNITVLLEAASTVSLLTSPTVTIDGSAGNDTFVATNGVLRGGQQINGGSGVNTLLLQGGGVFELSAPSVLTNIQVVDATESLISGEPIIFLRNGLNNLTVNIASAATNSQLSGAVVHGADDNDVINLGSGNDVVYLGSAAETVHGGSGSDTYSVASATIGATIDGGSGTNYLYVTGGGTEAMGANITRINAVFLETAGTSYDFTANATSGMVIHASADTDTIVVGSGSQTVIGSSGNLLVEATAANAGAAVVGGTGSSELEITTGGTVALNSATDNVTVQLNAANTLTLNHMEFIHAVGSGGNDVIIAGAAGQVLTGGGANDTLEDAGHYGVTFQDTVAGFSGDTLADFTKADTIDITGLSSTSASAIYTGTSTSGVLAVASGSTHVDIKMSGAISGGSFNVASDSHGGTLITY